MRRLSLRFRSDSCARAAPLFALFWRFLCDGSAADPLLCGAAASLPCPRARCVSCLSVRTRSAGASPASIASGSETMACARPFVWSILRRLPLSGENISPAFASSLADLRRRTAKVFDLSVEVKLRSGAC